MTLSVLQLYGGLDLPEAHVIKGLAERGVRLRILTEPDIPNLAIIEESDLQIEHWRAIRNFDLQAVLRLRRILRQGGIDVVHTFTTGILTQLLLALLGVPRRPKVIAYRGAIGNVRRIDPTCYLTYLNPMIDRIVCVSQAVERDLAANGVPKEKLQTIYKGHRIAWYQQEPLGVRALFDIPQDAFLIGSTANFRRTKGADVLLEAARIVAQRGFKPHFLLIGELRDERIQHLAAVPELKGLLHFTGFRRDAPRLIQECALFVMPSRDREGLPKGVIEAMAQGVPAVVTNVGGMPELIRHEQDGLVVPKEDPTALADAIVRMIEDSALRERAARSVKARIDEDFCVDRTVEQTLELYHSLIHQRG